MIQTLILRGIDPPYLIVRVVPSLFHLTVLPAHLSDEDLLALTRAQVRANGFDAFLVLAARHGLALPAEVAMSGASSSCRAPLGVFGIRSGEYRPWRWRGDDRMPKK